ncbi:MAG: TetR family transcriptional regulator [Desulfuromonadales bacterium]|nr:TetR family transcriptional regulator [Desulfuromonadales bacterium]
MISTYEKLIKDATEIMMQNGYSGTSVQMIAEKVKVSKSTVIHYFKSKEGILLAILGNFIPSAIAEFSPVVNDRSLKGVEKLRQFICFHLQIIAKSGDVYTLNIREARYLSTESRRIIENYQREYENMLVKIVDQIKKEDDCLFKNIDTHVAAKAIMGMCNSPTIWYKKGGLLSISEIANQFFGVLTAREKIDRRFQRPRPSANGPGSQLSS